MTIRRDTPRVTTFDELFRKYDFDGMQRDISKLFTTPSVEIVNDLVTGGTGKALSAEQGKNIASSNYQKKAVYNPQNDCNDNIEEWVLGGGGGASANYPDNNATWYVNTIHYTDVIRKQIAYEYNGDKMFMRHYLSSWSAWAPLHTEYGSNANGSYVKLADGTMICTGKKTYPSTAFAPTNNVYYAVLSAIVFPAEFLAAPIVTASIEMGNIGAMQVSAITTTQFDSIVLSDTSTARTPIVRYIAIGRWRA